jgi:hypothetical protein
MEGISKLRKFERFEPPFHHRYGGINQWRTMKRKRLYIQDPTL